MHAAALLVSLTVLAAPPRINVVRIAAHDFAYTIPDSIPAGITTFEMTNDGKEVHHAIFFRLEGGKHLADLLQAMGSGQQPMWAVPVGGPNGPAPGGMAVATLDLKPGRYAVLCAIPSGDGMPHVMKGMAKELVVTGKADPNARMPKADVNLTLKDYEFGFDKPLTAGKHVVQVNVAPGQPHEIVIVKLAPGKTWQDFAAWGEKPVGPPPGAFVGGIAPMVGGSPAQFTMDLTPGKYGLICFVPDAKDGKPHALHGMGRDVTVPAKAS
jgi:uncharacterized cupredoxin-like copper-binding protein